LAVAPRGPEAADGHCGRAAGVRCRVPFSKVCG
jgi:hypothetical protein